MSKEKPSQHHNTLPTGAKLTLAGVAAFALSVAGAMRTGLADSSSAPAFSYPKCKVVPSYEDFYPPTAIRLNLQGRVYVAFTIGQTGRVDKYKVISAEPGETFNKAALRILSKLRCDVPEFWEKQHGSEQEFRINFTFVLDSNELEPFAPSDDSITIRGASVARLK